MSAQAVTAPGAPARRGVPAFLRLVAIEHSVFALPFAYLSALVDKRWKEYGIS